MAMNSSIHARWRSDRRGNLRYEDGRRVIESWIQVEPFYLVDGCPKTRRRSVPTVRVTAIIAPEAECRVIHKRFFASCPWPMISRTNRGPWSWVTDLHVAWAIELDLTKVFTQAGVTAGVNALNRVAPQSFSGLPDGSGHRRGLGRVCGLMRLFACRTLDSNENRYAVR